MEEETPDKDSEVHEDEDSAHPSTAPMEARVYRTKADVCDGSGLDEPHFVFTRGIQ